MTRLSLFACLALVPGVCAADAPLAAPRCALDGAAAFKMAQLVEPQGARENAGPNERAAEKGPTESGAVAGLLSPASDVERVPALKHIAESGGAIFDLGFSHGLRSVMARQGEEFMLLQVAPDGEAVVAGLQSDLSISRLLAIAGRQVTELGSIHGLRGVFVRDGQQFQVFYVTPDGERVIAGVMWDATGKNLTREQVAPVAGAVPTVVLGDESSSPAGGGSRLQKSALELAEKTSVGFIGSASAPRLWMFIDPLCSYSVKALQEAQPYVAKGQVQIAIIPISVLDYEDNGSSTPSALALLSKEPDPMVAAWSRGDFSGKPAAEAETRLRTNMAAAEAIGLKGTPTILWRKADGSEGRINGAPTDWGAVIASMGGESHAALAR